MKKLFYIFVLIFFFSPSIIISQYWAKSIGSTDFDYGSSIAVDGSGNVYVTGRFGGTADFDPGSGTQNLTSAGSFDVFFAKYSANGAYVFAKSVGGTSVDVGSSIAVDGSGNIYVTGGFSGTADFDPGSGTQNLTAAGDPDIFFVKYSASGNYIYAKSIGGASVDVGYSIAVDGSGNVYVAGRFGGTADFDPGSGTQNLTSIGIDDIFFAKYDVSGSYIYAKRVGGISTDFGRSIVVDGSGNLYITGNYMGTADFDPGSGTQNLTSAGGPDVFFAKYSASGNYIYAKSIGGTIDDVGYSIAVDGSGNVYVTGVFEGTADFDPGTGTQNLTSAGGQDVFFAKYSASGNYIYAKSIGDTSDDAGSSIAVDGSGNIYVTGGFSGTADFDPGSGTQILTSALLDIFFAKYDANGAYVYAKNIGGSNFGIGMGSSIAVDGSRNVYVTGLFLGTFDFDPGSAALNLTSVGMFDIFFAKYNASGTLGIKLNEKPEIPLQFELSQNYPNPFNPSTTIRFGLPNESRVKLEIYNSLGQLISVLVDDKLSAHFYEVKWEPGKIPTGLYFYKLTAIDITDAKNNFIKTKKMILMK